MTDLVRPFAPGTRMRPAQTLDEELWRRSESRREAGLYLDANPSDRLLLPLILSLARLAAQRDAKASAPRAGVLANVE